MSGMYKVVLEYDDGREAVIEREVDRFADAAVFAIDLADRAGHVRGDGHGPPRWVKMYRGTYLELAISVIPGGLVAPAVAERSRLM